MAIRCFVSTLCTYGRQTNDFARAKRLEEKLDFYNEGNIDRYGYSRQVSNFTEVHIYAILLGLETSVNLIAILLGLSRSNMPCIHLVRPSTQ